MKYFLFLLLSFCPLLHAATQKVAVVIPSYNNERWVKKNLSSVFEQTYSHLHIYYINDASQDHTAQEVEQCIARYKSHARCTVIHNPIRLGALSNLYHLIHRLDPHTIVITVDGDDWLKDPHAIEKVVSHYAEKDTWMTYGNFISNQPGWNSCCEKIPKKIAKKNRFRSFRWVSSHLRTFYAALFQKIKFEDLLVDGQFFSVAWDMAFMFPMLEMSSKGHCMYIKEPLYVYNVHNPLNDYRTQGDKQRAYDAHIRKKSPYKPLKKLF